MDWSMLFQVTIPLFGAGAWLWSRIDKKFEKQENTTNGQFNSMNKRIEGLENKVDDGFQKTRTDIHDLKERISKQEGRLEILSNWVEKMIFDKTGTH